MEHRCQRIHQASGPRRTLYVHRVVVEFTLFQRDGGDLRILSPDVDQKAKIAVDLLAGGTQSQDMLSSLFDRSPGVGVVFHQHHHPVGQGGIDVYQRRFDLKAGTSGQSDLKDFELRNPLPLQIAKDLFDRIDRIAGVGVGTFVEHLFAGVVADDQLGHRRADIQPQQYTAGAHTLPFSLTAAS